MSDQPVDLANVKSLEDLLPRLNVLFEDIYGRLLAQLQYGDAITASSLTGDGSAADDTLLQTVQNNILTALRDAKIIEE